MTTNPIKTLFRNMRRNRAISIINIFGLVLGITSSVFIMEYVYYERSYDNYHENGDNVYRLVYDRYRGETLLWKTANSFYPAGYYLKTKYAEVVDYFNLMRNHNIEVFTDASGEKISFFENKTYLASASILEILDIPLISGNKDCLNAPNSVIVSEKAAKKYFKDIDPIGKVMCVNNSENYTVTGVFKNIPTNSHIKSDLLFSYATFLSKNSWALNSWEWDFQHTYIQLQPGTDFKSFEKKAFPLMVEENYSEILSRNAEHDEFYLQPIKSIHLNSAIEYELEPPGNGTGINVLYGFALFLLFIAWINYINLITACSIDRAKEVGVKKVYGSHRIMLIKQFLTEAFLINLICIAISVFIIILLIPVFKQFTGVEQFGSIFGLRFWLFTIVFIFSGVFLSGLYPAFILSSVREIEVLKGCFKRSPKGILLRKILVTFQLFVSLILLAGTFIVNKQVKFLSEKDLGYDYHATLIIKAPRTNEELNAYRGKIELLGNNLRKNPDVSKFTSFSDVPGKEIEGFFGGYRKGLDPGNINYYYCMNIDPDFMSFFKSGYISGRDFNMDDKLANDKIVVNLKAMQRLGFDSPEEAIGKIIMDGSGKEFELIGVVNDINYYSVKAEAMPLIYTVDDNRKQYMAIQYRTDTDTRSLIQNIESEYEAIFPNNAFDFEILENSISNMLQSDRAFAMILGVASVLALVISVIGVVGLIIITINQNMKSTGVRKVLGANFQSIFFLLFKQFYLELVIAICMATFAAYYGFTYWVLNQYIYRISISWQQLLLPVIIILTVIALVIWILSKRAFTINLIRVLKTE